MSGGGEGFSGHHGLPRTSFSKRASGAKGGPSQAALGAEGNPPAQAQGRAQAPTGNQQLAIREQDRFMPIANVIRIMRKVLPTHAKISDDAKETIQECVSEYISFITSEANERCRREQRKTVTAEDLLWAMSKLGFDDYVEPLTLYLQRYRELEGDNRGSLRGPDPLPVRKHHNPPSAVHHPPNPQHHSGIDSVGAPQHFNPMPPQPPPSFVIPPASAASHSLYKPGLYSGDGIAGYYHGMYGNGPDGAGSSSNQAPPGMPSSDHIFPPYK